MRTKHQIHCLTGHDNTVGAILTKGVDPQVRSLHVNLCSLSLLFHFFC